MKQIFYIDIVYTVCMFCRSRYIPTETKVLLALHFYATGDFLISLSDFSGMSTSSSHRHLRTVTLALCGLSKEFIAMPSTEEERLDVAKCFYNKAKFPRVLGAIVCTHVRIQSTGGNMAEEFRNRKGHSNDCRHRLSSKVHMNCSFEWGK